MSFSAFVSCRVDHGRRLLGAVGAAGVIALLALGLSTPGARADTCGNAALRALNSSAELPDCRAYEMVSSPYKQGFDLIPNTFTDDGIVSYYSTGNFVGNPVGDLSNQYLGVRTPEGWETRSLEPSLALYEVGGLFPVFASDLRSTVWTLSPRDQSGDGTGLYVGDFDGKFTRLGEGPVPVPGILAATSASDDLSHVILGSVYEYVGAGGAAVVRHVSVDNNGVTMASACSLGISGDGRVAVFAAGCGTRLWARIGGAVTVAVSGSECTRGVLDLGGACNGLSPATYVGGAVDGSRLFMTTDQQLSQRRFGRDDRSVCV